MLVLGLGLAFFAAIAWAVRFHFASQARPWRFVLVSIASAANVAVFAHVLWRFAKPIEGLVAALILFVAAAVLFAASIAASRSAALKLLFDADKPQAILQTGPYRFIRHPFYASYVLYYLGCAVATLHPFNIGFLLVLLPVLVVGARGEEAAFAQSPSAADYADYRRRAGLFWPRLWTSKG